MGQAHHCCDGCQHTSPTKPPQMAHISLISAGKTSKATRNTTTKHKQGDHRRGSGGWPKTLGWPKCVLIGLDLGPATSAASRAQGPRVTALRRSHCRCRHPPLLLPTLGGWIVMFVMCNVRNMCIAPSKTLRFHDYSSPAPEQWSGCLRALRLPPALVQATQFYCLRNQLIWVPPNIPSWYEANAYPKMSEAGAPCVAGVF